MKCEIEVIDKGKYFWINWTDLEIEIKNRNKK